MTEPHPPGSYSSETVETLMGRASVRAYTDREVPDAMVETILAAAFRAPTSSNIQAYSVIVVRDAATRQRLSEITRQRRHILEAPVFLAFCADMTRIETAMATRGRTLSPTTLEDGLLSTVDAALVGMSAYLAAESLGLKGVMIGAVRNDALAAAAALGLPKLVYAVYGMCLGWPAETPKQKPRLPLSATVFSEVHGRPWPEGAPGGEPPAPVDVEAVLSDYDTALGAHYNAVGKPTTPDSWTADLHKKFSARLRANLRAELKQQGFDFE